MTATAPARGDPARHLALCPVHVEELLAGRGFDISYETVRRWVLKFGTRLRAAISGFALASKLRRPSGPGATPQ